MSGKSGSRHVSMWLNATLLAPCWQRFPPPAAARALQPVGDRPEARLRPSEQLEQVRRGWGWCCCSGRQTTAAAPGSAVQRPGRRPGHAKGRLGRQADYPRPLTPRPASPGRPRPAPARQQHRDCIARRQGRVLAGARCSPRGPRPPPRSLPAGERENHQPRCPRRPCSAAGRMSSSCRPSPRRRCLPSAPPRCRRCLIRRRASPRTARLPATTAAPPRG